METPQQTSIEVLVFATNIRHKKDVARVASLMQTESRIRTWHVDRSDRSKVLRIESQNLHPSEVVSLITQAGFLCEELPD